MAGIIGYYDPDGILAEDSIDVMVAAQFHDESYVYDSIKRDWGAIGIIDNTSNGKPQIVNLDNKETFIAYRGDLDKLSNLHYPIGGKNLLDLKGHFSSAILHDKNKTINLVNDRFGHYPIYFAKYKNALIFSSEQKSILALGVIPTEMDKISISLVLSIGEVCGDRTLFENIKTLPSASILTAGNSEVNTKKYWKYKYQADNTLGWTESVRRVSEAFEAGVQRICNRHKEIGVPLSGGLDSRLLLSLATKYSKVTSFTWGVDYSKDIIVARKVAQQFGSKHNEIDVNGDYLPLMAAQGVWLTEGLTSITNFHVLPHVARVASESSSILDGLAGDAILGGNFINDAWLNTSNIEEAAESIWNWRHSGWMGEFNTSGMDEENILAKQEFIKTFKSYDGLSPMDKAMAFLIDNRVRRNSICGTEMLRSKLNTYHPFFDYDFIDVVSEVPHKWRRRHKFYLAVLNRLSPKAANIIWDRTALPASSPFWLTWLSLAFHKVLTKIVNKFHINSKTFSKNPSPFATWFREDLSDYVSEILLDEKTLSRGWVPRDVLINAVSGHMQNKFDASAFIGSMIRLELFARLFVDDLTGSINKLSHVNVDSSVGEK